MAAEARLSRPPREAAFIGGSFPLSAMKTYLVVWFSSDGAKPTEVTKRLLGLGFRAVRGTHDYIYEWGKNARTDDIIRFGDKVQITLQGTGVTFRLETAGSETPAPESDE